MDCEICGRKEAVCLVSLEGAKMNSCQGCARGGKVLYYFEGESEPAPAFSAMRRSEEEITDGYGKIIKNARTKTGLSIEQLGMKIAEKANYLDHIERGEMLPSISVAHKLEKFLKIKLVETATTSQTETKISLGKRELTLLDVAEIEKKERRKK